MIREGFIDVLIRARTYAEALPLILHLKTVASCWSLFVLVLQEDSVSSHDDIIIIHFDRSEFNYSRALNLGLPALTAPYTLICSSHSYPVVNHSVFEECVSLFEADLDCAAMSFAPYTGAIPGVWSVESARPDLTRDVVSHTTFNGFNGLDNSCALLRSDLLRRHCFDETVPCVEDKFWTHEMLRQGYSFYDLSAVFYRNLNNRKKSYKKARDRYVIASNFRRDLLQFDHITAEFFRGWRSLLACDFVKFQERMLFVWLAFVALFVKHRFTSDY